MKAMWNAAPTLLVLFTMVFFGCKKKEESTEPGNNVKTGTVTDIDGNVYKTVTIGSQEWMAENLKTTRYRNGDTIPEIDDTWDWWHATTGAWCNYDNLHTNDDTYGKLYNWHAVNTGILPPQGWHVPTAADWVTLENFLGIPNVAGGKLKEIGTTHWQSPNIAATNETGFKALPGGTILSTGSFSSFEYSGYWWAASEGTDPAYGQYRWLDFNSGFFFISEDYKVDGLSVRCVKD